MVCNGLETLWIAFWVSPGLCVVLPCSLAFSQHAYARLHAMVLVRLLTQSPTALFESWGRVD